MKKLIEKLISVEKRISDKKGAFQLFALFLREDASDVWDLVVSASWAFKNKTVSLQYLSSQLNKTLSQSQMLKLSRIVIIEPDNPALEAMHKAMQIEHGSAELKDCNFFGLQIKRAFVITSKRIAPPNKSLNSDG
ncbi:hypothetical protein KQH27_00515 [bacterium]|nr:hypothetical protein [bacterium]